MFRLTAEGAEDAKTGRQAVQTNFSDRSYRIDGINFSSCESCYPAQIDSFRESSYRFGAGGEGEE